MNLSNREWYLFQKKSLLILLYLYYINDVSYDGITFKSFGFKFDPTINFKVFVNSKKGHLHKYGVHIYNSVFGVNFEEIDIMGNVNIVKVKNISDSYIYEPNSSVNIYFDESNFYAIGFVEGEKIDFKLRKSIAKKDDLLYFLNSYNVENINSSASSFLLWILKLHTHNLHIDLIMGAGINCDYGAKDWKSLVNALNLEFVNGDKEAISEIKHYVGQELFVNCKFLNTAGFDINKSLNNELYEFEEAKSFNDPDSTLYHCVNFIEKHPHISVITYNYDTNLEYLLKKRTIKYVTIYDDNSYVDQGVLVDIYHVHGLLPYEKNNEHKYTDSLIFNESEYFYLYNNPYAWNIYKQLHDFKFNACILIGISLTDPNMKRLLELARNYLKFNFIFIKREEGYSEKTYRDVTNYMFNYDLITIWVDDYEDIGKWLEMI